MNFDIRQSGQISYEIHSMFTELMSIVNSYIQQQDDEEFIGTWMMVANFKEAPHDGSTENKVDFKVIVVCFVLMFYLIDK